MTVYTIHSQRPKKVAESMALEVRAKITSQGQRVAHHNAIRLERAIELGALLLQHLQIESVVVCNKQNVRTKELEELLKCIHRIDAMLVEMPWICSAQGFISHVGRI